MNNSFSNFNVEFFYLDVREKRHLARVFLHRVEKKKHFFLKKNRNVIGEWTRTLNHEVMSRMCYPLGHSDNTDMK